MTPPEPHVYRTSDQFADAYRAYQEQYRAHADKVTAYCDTHPEHPIAFTRSRLSLQVTARGFKDVTPDAPAPDGLSRKRGRDYLIPVRGPRGQRWRDELASLGSFPSVEKVCNTHGFDTFTLGDTGFFTMGVEDCGEHGMFIKIGEPFQRTSEHLTPVPLSEYYLAHEAHRSAPASP